MELFIRSVIASALLYPVGGWALMLMMGIAHHDMAPSVPALGFWLCMVLVMLGSFVKSAVAPNVSDDNK